MLVTKKYKNAPLVEVLCEFTFDDFSNDFTQIDTNFGRAIESEFPERVEKVNVTFNFKVSEIPTAKSVAQQVELIQYYNREKNRIVQIGPNLLAINQLKPYVSWEEFNPLVMENLNLYKKIVDFKSIKSIKLRYVNKIELLDSDNNVGDFFRYSIMLPDEVSKDLANIKLTTEHFYKRDRDVLSISLYNTTASSEGSISFVFDLTYALVKPDQVDYSEIEDWLTEAHQNINTIFEAALTEKCKQLFN